MSYEDNYDQTARWDAESVREAEQRTQHRSTRSSAERQKLKKKGQRRRLSRPATSFISRCLMQNLRR